MNEPYIVSFIVNRETNEVSSINVLYSMNTKTEPAGSLSPGVPAKADYLTGSIIGISDLLDYVNKFFPDILPESVLKHYGYEGRPEGILNGDILYQDREGINTEADYLNKAAEGSPDFHLFDFDDDLFENEDNAIDFDKMVRDDPQQALELMYKSIVRQARESLADKDSGLTENSYRKIAQKLIPKYAVEDGHLIEVTNTIRNFIENTDSENFEEKFTDFVLSLSLLKQAPT